VYELLLSLQLTTVRVPDSLTRLLERPSASSDVLYRQITAVLIVNENIDNKDLRAICAVPTNTNIVTLHV